MEILSSERPNYKKFIYETFLAAYPSDIKKTDCINISRQIHSNYLISNIRKTNIV